MSEGMIPEVTGWVNNDGGFGSMDSAPDSVKGLVENKGFKGVEDIANAYTNLESMKGDWANPESMKLPETLNEDHISQIYGKMGVPENADGYTYDFGDKQIDSGLLDSFKGLATESKFTQEQFTKAIDFWESAQSKGKESYDAELKELIEKGETKLKDSWADSYDDNLTKANEFAQKTGLDKLFENYGINEFPDVREKLFELSKMTDESELPNETDNSEASIQQQIEDIQKHEAFMDRLHPEHGAIISKWHELLRKKMAG